MAVLYKIVALNMVRRLHIEVYPKVMHVTLFFNYVTRDTHEIYRSANDSSIDDVVLHFAKQIGTASEFIVFNRSDDDVKIKISTINELYGVREMALLAVTLVMDRALILPHLTKLYIDAVDFEEQLSENILQMLDKYSTDLDSVTISETNICGAVPDTLVSRVKSFYLESNDNLGYSMIVDRSRGIHEIVQH